MVTSDQKAPKRFNSNEERISFVKEKNRQLEEHTLAEETKKHAPFGGLNAKKSCYKCKYYVKNSRGLDRCTSDAVKLQSDRIIDAKLRMDEGVCGPDGIFFQKQPLVDDWSAVMVAIAISAVILGGIGCLFYFLGWFAAIILFGILVLVGMAAD